MKSRFDSPCRLVFIIVTWNRKDKLRQCLDSLDEYIRAPHDILVVDNASSDGTSEMVETEYPEVLLLRNLKNAGFSRAANQGLDYLGRRNLQWDYAVFLNDDAAFRDESMQRLVDYLEKNPHVHAALPSVFVGTGRLQTGAGGYELSLLSAFYYFFGLSICFPPLFKGFFFHQPYYRKKGFILELDWISGVCLVLRGKTAERLRFPEDYFMYAEDVALCRDIKKYGKIIYFPYAQVFHEQEKNGSPFRSSLWLDSLFHYYRRHNRKKNRGRLQLLKIIFLAGFLMRSGGYFLLEVFSGRDYQMKRKELLGCTRYVWERLGARAGR